MTTAMELALEAAGRLFAVAVLGFFLLRGGGNPLLFPAIHLIFVAFFTLIGVTGLFSMSAAPTIVMPSARLAFFLPHLTIIAGGFCLVLLRLRAWLAWGILAGKVFFEAASLAVARAAQRKEATDSGSGPDLER